MGNPIKSVLDQLRDYMPTSHPQMIKTFMEGSVYQDFLRELAIRIEQMRDFNEECGSKEYLETRGGIKALRLVAGIFEDLYNNSINDNTITEDVKDAS